VFYRRLNDELFTSADLTNAFVGAPIFIVAASPIINELPLGELERSALPTLALNNVLYSYPKPTMWLTADKPACYGGHFFARADIIKFAYMNYRDDVVGATGKPLKEHPMQLFYNATEDKSAGFFSEEPAFIWWKSVFPLALQLAWRLGSRRVYLVGCSFDNSSGAYAYAYASKLNEFQAQWSQLTYNDDVRRLRQFEAGFNERGFQVISCTPNSRANKFLPYHPLSDAIEAELRMMPQPTSISELKHSSEFRPRVGGTSTGSGPRPSE